MTRESATDPVYGMITDPKTASTTTTVISAALTTVFLQRPNIELPEG
jgi:hypothetical protein